MGDWARQILDFAIAKEQAAEKFYLRWAERSDDGACRQHPKSRAVRNARNQDPTPELHE